MSHRRKTGPPLSVLHRRLALFFTDFHSGGQPPNQIPEEKDTLQHSAVHSLLAFRSLKSLKSNLRQCLPLSLRRCFVSVYTNHESVSDHESFFDYIIGLLQTCQCMYRIQINLLNHESLFWRILEFESKFVTRSIRTLTSCCSLSLSLFILCCRAVWPVPGCCFYCRDFRRERRLVARKCFQDIDQRVCNFLNPSRVEYVFKSLFCLDYASVGK